MKLSHQAIAAMLILATLTGCKSKAPHDSIASENQYTPASQIPTEIPRQTPAQRFQLITESYTDWTDVQANVRAALISPTSLSVNTKAAMKRGQWISLSVRVLGFEVASVFVTSDSIYATEKMHHYLVCESISDLIGSNDVTINDIQDLLLGHAFILGEKKQQSPAALLKKVIFSKLGDGANANLVIAPARQPQNFEYAFMAPADANCISVATMVKPSGSTALLYYSGFTSTPAGSSAANVKIEAKAASAANAKTASASLTWDFSSAKWNSGVQKSWKRPSGYTVVPASQLLGKLSSI